MHYSLKAELNAQVKELYRLRAKYAGRKDIGLYDTLVRICLRIAAMLIQDGWILRTIGKELRLVVVEPRAQMQPLKFDLSLLTEDLDLEENLRGFSNLLNWILEDNIIRSDPKAMLGQIPGIDGRMRQHFDELANVMLAYLNLEAAFLLNGSKALATLFLLSVCKISDALIEDQKDLVMKNWLKARVKNEALENLLEKALPEPKPREIESLEQRHKKDLWIVTICLRMAKGPVITNEEEPFFDMGLKQNGMMELKPFLENGIFTLATVPKKIAKNHLQIDRKRY